MGEHLTCVESHPGSMSHLLPGVQNELLYLMPFTVRQSLLRNNLKAKYYVLLFDLIPNKTHPEQMSEVVMTGYESGFQQRISRK